MENIENIQEIKLINEIISQNPPVIKKHKKQREQKTTKVCKICNIEKDLSMMVINETLGFNRPEKLKINV